MDIKTVCEINLCTACGVCADICPGQAIKVADQIQFINAIVDEKKCINCGLCEKVCQVVSNPVLTEPKEWFQGWGAEAADRDKSSSGAFAYVLAKQIISEDGYVASCTFENGNFSYKVINSVEQLEKFRGSKYVKSNPEGIYSSVKKLLQQNKKVLFIGLPCHVAALKKYLWNKEYENLITIDMICHGSPSPKLLDEFLVQYNLSLKAIDKIYFRQKGTFRLTGEILRDDRERDIISFTQPGIRDRYLIAFLSGLIFTENCYHCYYAGAERVSDITIGDSWGSNLSVQEKRRGISIALCQTQKGISFLKRSQILLYDVDIVKAIAANHQLRGPFPKPAKREVFFTEMEKGGSFNRAVNKSLPRVCFRLDLKNLLVKAHVLK